MSSSKFVTVKELKKKHKNEFYHTVNIVKKEPPLIGEEPLPSKYNNQWYEKEVNKLEAMIEVVSQEFCRLIDPHQPKTRLLEKNNKSYVLSKEIKSFITFYSLKLKNFKKNIKDGDITGLGIVILLALFLYEEDLKPDNIGLDSSNHVVKIDGGHSLAQLNSRNANRNFEIIEKVISSLPYLDKHHAYNWLDIIAQELENVHKSRFVDSDMANNVNFRNEVNRTILKILVLPDDFFVSFAKAYVPDHYAKIIATELLNRRNMLQNAAYQNESFKQFIKTNEAKKCVKELNEHLKTFTTTKKNLLPCDSLAEKVEKQFKLVSLRITSINSHLIDIANQLIDKLTDNINQLLLLHNFLFHENEIIGTTVSELLKDIIQQINSSNELINKIVQEIKYYSKNNNFESTLYKSLEDYHLNTFSLIRQKKDLRFEFESLLAYEQIDNIEKHQINRSPQWLNNLKNNVKLNNDWESLLNLVDEENSLAKIKKLIQNGVNINIVNQDGDTALILAIQAGQFDTVKYLIQHGAYINYMNKMKQTALMFAAQMGQIEIVEYLVEHGANVNAIGQNHMTPLMIAIQHNQIETVKYLLQANAEVNVIDIEGGTPLLRAARKGYLEIVKCLLAANADIDFTNENGETPLIVASRKGNFNIVNCLLEQGANVNSATKDGKTSLIYAAARGHLEVVKLLLTKHPDPYMTDNHGLTALHYAQIKDRIDVAECLNQTCLDMNLWAAIADKNFHEVNDLIDKGADVNTAIVDVGTPLMFAVQNGHLEIIKLLIEQGASIDAVDPDGYTVFDYTENDEIFDFLDKKALDLDLFTAIKKGDLYEIKRLLELGASTNAKNLGDETPLMFAADCNQFKALNLLIEQGAELNAVNQDQYTALNYAISTENVSMVEYLVEKGINVNTADIEKNATPLMFAAYYGNLNMVKCLVQNGAKIDAVTKDGVTACELAKISGNQAVVEFLAHSSRHHQKPHTNSSSRLFSHSGATASTSSTSTTNTTVSQKKEKSINPKNLSSNN